MDNNLNNTFQNLILENREKLNVSGVLDVLSFDDQIIIVETSLGLLTIKGEDLKIFLKYLHKCMSLNFLYVHSDILLDHKYII